MYMGSFLAMIITITLNIIIGTFLSMILYEQNFKDSFKFILVISLFLLIIRLIVDFITWIILLVIFVGLKISS